VETNQPGHQSSTNPTLLARIGWAVLIIATLYVCYFSHLGAIGFVGPDEPRYAWIARDMAETGDWVTPRLYGKPWFEKPPLLYWGAALSFKLFGVSDAAARLPSAISALLATLALAWLALRLYGAETARWLLLFLPTTVGMIGFSHAAATDMPFSAMLSIAMVAAAVVVGLGQGSNGSVVGDVAARGALRPSSGQASPSSTRVRLALVCFGFFLGLAVLAKGPAGIILCGGSVSFWAVFTKRWRDTFRLLHPAAIGAFCVTALPWYVLCARRNPDFVRVFIIEHNFKRYLTPEFQHIQPFWYYIPILLIALLPWTLLFLLFMKDAARLWRGTGWFNSPRLFFTCWVIFPVLFFSMSKSKLPGYILPALLPLGLPMAHGISSHVVKTLRDDRWSTIGSGMTLIALGILVFLQVEWIDLGSVSSVLTATGLTMVMLGSLRRSCGALLLGVVGLNGAIALTLAGTTGQTLDQRLSSRPAITAAFKVWSNFSPEHSSTYNLQRSFQYSLNFYFHRELPAWSPDRAGSGWVFASGKQVIELRNQGLTCPFVALRRAVIVCEDPGLGNRSSGRGQPQ
jgi:4-amino-4-deoxy-L-arabinose transferase-like glycosyltransferase